jgi:hypothetical protein
MLRRMASSLYSHGKTTWKFGEWDFMPGWDGGPEVAVASEWLRERGSDLYQPSPVPIDRATSGQIDGMPGIAQPI